MVGGFGQQGAMAYVRRVREQWCVYCQERHGNDRWYLTCGGGAYCHYAYRLAQHLNLRDAPIAFLWLREHKHDVDRTGSRIVALRHRPDVRGLSDVWAMVSAAPGWRGHAAFACGFALQLYWPQSMLIFAVELLKYSFHEVNRTVLIRVLSLVRRRMHGLRMVDGVLCAGSRGLDPMSNPSERRNGSVRYLSLASEVDEWSAVANYLEVYMRGTERSCGEMLRIVRQGRLVSYGGVCDYGNMRLLRCLLYSAGGTMPDGMEWWSHLCRMSPHLRGVAQRNAMSYEVVVMIRDRLRADLDMESYSLLDLTCFLCLVRTDIVRRRRRCVTAG